MDNFKLFGTSHIIFLLFEILMILLLFLKYKKIKKSKKLTVFFRYIFVVIHLGFEVAYYVWAFSINMPVKKLLPLELCSLSLYLTVLFLIFNSEKIWQFTFPLTIINATLTCLFGMANGYDFPHIRFLQFFLNHGLLIISNLFGALVLNYNMGFKEFKRTIITTYIICVPVFFLNKIMFTNYMYLNYAPNAMSYWQVRMGGFYIIPSAIILTILYYIPVYFLKFKTTKRKK